MYDCYSCKVPLHDHEAICPNCGAKQKRRSVSKLVGQAAGKKPVNMMPFVITFVMVAAGFGLMAQSSWMGQLMHRGPKVEDPMDKLSYLDARNIVEQKITEGMTAAGAKCEFKWTRAGADVDKASEGPLEATCNVVLTDTEQRRAIIDPVKDYFAKAQITTLTVQDDYEVDGQKKHATWTYTTVTPKADAQPE